jgi:hypothetical protein
MRTDRRWCVVVLLAVVALGGSAEEPKPPSGKLALTTERVVIFKDGYGLFVKTAAGTLDTDGRVFTDTVPDGAVLGTFWATTDQGKVPGMVAEWVQRKEERSTETPCISTVELLRANKGKRVTLARVPEKAADVVGTILEVLDLPPEKTPATPRPEALGEPAFYSAAYRPSGVAGSGGDHPAETVRELVPRGGQLVALTTDTGRLVLPVAEIRTVAGADLVTTMARREEVSTWTKRLSFDFGKDQAGKKASLRILYFTEGIRWIPTYRINGALVDKADLALQGELLNEAEDFENAAVDLVVGVPNFRFKNTISPLSLERTLRNALATAAPNLMIGNNALSNAQFSQRAGEWRGAAPEAAGAGGGVLALAPELAAGGQQDMFVYSAKTFSLKKGARATLPLWQNTVPLSHVYTLDLKMARSARSGSGNDRSAGNQNDVSPLRLSENQCWHQLEFSNTSPVPWTTGAALIMHDNLPLGQDLLTYTSPGTRVLLPMTVAVDMRGSLQEEELNRQPNALHWSDHNWSKIRKSATVTVTNNRKEESAMRVTVSLGGLAERVSGNGTVRVNDYRRDDWYDYWSNDTINNHSDVSWQLTLEPGETKTLTFEFMFYVP